MIRFFKYFFFLSSLAVFSILAWCLFIYQDLRFSTPSLAELAERLNPFSVAVAFNYSKNINKQLYLFSKNIGLENNPLTKQEEPPKGDIGANGFVILDVRSNYSNELFKKLDDVLNEGMELIEQPALENKPKKKLIVNETDSSEEIKSPFEVPLAALVEEIWNGKTFAIGGATQFHLSFEDSMALALEPYIKNYIKIASSHFRNMIIKNFPKYLEDFLNKHSLNIDIEPAFFQLDASIHESQVNLSIDDSNGFLESICSAKINPWDMCGRFSLNREKFRNSSQSILGLVTQNFKVSLNIFWTIRGEDIIYSNQKELLIEILNENKNKENNNILVDVSSSGDDFLINGNKNLKYASLSVYLDLIKAQNEGITFFDAIRKNSQVMSDFFGSPDGDYLFYDIEKKINDFTQFSRKMSIAFHMDGERLLPELRLYSPSNDIFIKNGKELSPEFINSLRVFVTKSVSFGNYLLPRGLIPIPGPIFTRNGKWVILKSDINIKSFAPFLQSIDPFIDKYDNPSSL